MTTRITALLFAMVDAVLADSLREAKVHHKALIASNVMDGRAGNAHAYALQLTQHLGWWRSTW